MPKLNDFYPGQRVRITTCFDWETNRNGDRSPDGDEAPRDTYVIGVYRGYVQVYKPAKYGGYPVVIDGKSYQETWSVAEDALEVIIDKPIKVYPRVCPKCKSPARKMGKAILCSNTRCKTRYNFKKSLPARIIPADLDKDGFVMCHICKSTNMFSRGTCMTIDGKIPFHHIKIVCPDGHKRVHVFETGHKLKNGETSRYYVWNGRSFDLTTLF